MTILDKFLETHILSTEEYLELLSLRENPETVKRLQD